MEVELKRKKGVQAPRAEDKSDASSFEVLNIFHEEEVGSGYYVRICKVKVYDKIKLEIRIFRCDNAGEMKPTRHKIDFPWSDEGTHEELLAFLIGCLINGANKMGIDTSEYFSIKHDESD